MKHISEIIKQIKDKNPKWIEREQKQDSQLDILFKKTIPNYYNNKYKTK